MRKIKDIKELQEICKELKLKGQTIGLSHGVFDLIHPGHIHHFISAKQKVDFLIVSITSEDFVNKGPGRPVFSDEIRLASLSAFEAIDFVTISRDKTSENIIEAIKPNIYFKGSDYKDPSDDPTGKINVEAKLVERHGGKVVFTDGFTSSSSKLINSFFSDKSKTVSKWIEEFRKDYSVDDIDYYFKLMSNLEVNLIGEVILDQYTYVEALGKSSKDPILAFRLLDTELYAGGILAIANNCAAWVKKVNVISAIGKDDNRPSELAKLLNPNINLLLNASSQPTITKHRYIDVGTNAKVFETYDYAPETLHESELDNFRELLNKAKSSELFLVADYGHGLLSNKLILEITSLSSYIAINTQANAGNRGFNTLSKYPRADFFAANSGELSLEFRDKNLNYREVVPTLMAKLGANGAVLTLGADGLMVFNERDLENAPALASKVIDKVGAGDSVFAIASLLSYLKAPLPIIGLVSNLVAAHEVSQLGHRTTLSIGDIKKQVKSMLG